MNSVVERISIFLLSRQAKKENKIELPQHFVDDLNVFGSAENVFAELRKKFPSLEISIIKDVKKKA